MTEETQNLNIADIYKENNVADLLNQDTLNLIGDDIITGFDDDKESRRSWEDEMKEAMDLAMQIKGEKTFPWTGASNVKMPLLTEAAIQFNSRMYPALIPDKDLVKCRVIGADPDGSKNRQATRVSKHMSYQMLEEQEEWEEEMDIGLIVLPILGNMYKKTYFNGRIYSDMLSPAEFVINNNAKSMETAYRKSHILYKTENDVRLEVLQGNYLDIELGEPQQKDNSGKVEENNHPKVDKSTPYKFIEQHTWWDLDNDGLEEPYIITVEYNSKKVVRIDPCFDINKTLVNEKEEIIDIKQIQYFTKYGFIPNPDGGIMDLGLGKLLGPTNHSVNTLINQLIDAGTKANMGGGFLGRGVKIRGGSLRFTMGEFKRVDSTGDDLRKNIVSLPTPEPSGVLFNLLGLLINAGQRLASTLDSQIGEDPGQNQKATTTMAVQEQGQKIFNGIYKRDLRSLNKEIKKHFYLNSIHLPTESYLNVLDANLPEEIGKTIKRDDYDIMSLNIVASADRSYASQQMKMAKSRALWEKVPTGLINPQLAMLTMLEAEEQPNIEALMKVQPPQPSIDMLKLQHQKQIDWANIEIEALKLDQEDLKAYADSILKLANAEAAEEGTQIKQYAAELQALTVQFAERRERATTSQPTSESGVSGLEEQPSN
jgi:chaperonin GroES